MRTVKFRAWDKVHDLGMLPVSQLSWDEHDDGIVRLHFCGALEGKLQGSFGVHSGVGNVDGSEETGWVLMQYTGLKDRNGKEIYEGDIVNSSATGIKSEVIWRVEQASFRARQINRKSVIPECPSLYALALEETEVIGNICEDPGLVEDKK